MFFYVKTLPNYVLKQDPIVSDVKHQDVQEGSTTLVQLVNNASVDYRIVVKKVDKETAHVLQGAQFELGDSANKQLKFTYNEQAKAYQLTPSGTAILETNDQGEIVIKNLVSLQKYTLKETKAPQGYKINSTSNSYEIFIKSASDSIVQDGISLTNVICENEKISTPLPTPTSTAIPSASEDSATQEVTSAEVKTGDKTNVMPLVFLLIVGASGILFVWIKKKSKN